MPELRLEFRSPNSWAKAILIKSPFSSVSFLWTLTCDYSLLFHASLQRSEPSRAERAKRGEKMKTKGEGENNETRDPISKSLYLPARKEDTQAPKSLLRNWQVKLGALPYILVVRCAKKHLYFLHPILEYRSSSREKHLSHNKPQLIYSCI